MFIHFIRITFLPIATINQFNNYFNLFFLFTAVVCAIPEISPLDPMTSLGPFIFVIAVSLVKEAVEDYKKTTYDKLYNNSPTLKWDKETRKFEQVKWSNVHVGEILKVEKNEIIPCDVLVIKSSEENGFCYLETTNLDGENALKPREAIYITTSMITEESNINELAGQIEVDPPDNNIYKLKGTLYLNGYEKCYFDINNALLRGGRLKNTEYVYGVVIYTGKDTKMMKNIKHGPLKLSSIDTKLNTVVIYILLIVLLLCVICTIFGAFFRNENSPDYINRLLNKEYIFYYDPDTYESSNDVLEIIRIFASLFIMYNTLIPISLMVSYQIIKSLQVVLMDKDPQLALDPEDKVKILSLALHEDLGTVKYIFTDKTGTLTRNEMEFKACSMFTKLFDDEEEGANTNAYGFTNNKYLYTENVSSSYMPQNANNNNTKKSIFAKTFDKNVILEALNTDIPLDIPDLRSCPFRSYKEAILESFINIVTNHNVLTEIDKKTKNKSFQGSNPDEVTLVSSAAELGIEFLDRDLKNIRVKILGSIETFQILYKFDFTSSRLRSSIIVRDSQERIKLYLKGADTVILARVNKFSEEFIKPKLKEHLDSFAKRGLRTLCYSFKNISVDEFAAWEENYKDILGRARNDETLAKEVEATIADLENDMTLLGVTALEDKLQDNVKNDLQSFIEAGINVWMITGDKLDTAETIGHSCKLFNDDTEVFKIRSGSKQETIDRMKEIMEKMKIMEKEMEQLREKGLNSDKERVVGELVQVKENRRSIKSNTRVSKRKLQSTIVNNKHTANFTKSYNSTVNRPPILDKIETRILQEPKEIQVKEFNDLQEFIQENQKKSGFNSLSKSKFEDYNKGGVAPITSEEERAKEENKLKIHQNKLEEEEYIELRYTTTDKNAINSDRNTPLAVNGNANTPGNKVMSELIEDDKSPSVLSNLRGRVTNLNRNQNEITNRPRSSTLFNYFNRHKSTVSEPKFIPREASFYSGQDKSMNIPSSPYHQRREEEINDLSIMNLLMDKNFFENSSDQLNVMTFWNKMNRKSSASVINPIASNLGMEDMMNKTPIEPSINKIENFKLNQNDLQGIYYNPGADKADISKKENYSQDSPVNNSNISVRSEKENSEIKMKQMQSLINIISEKQNEKIISLKTIKEEDECNALRESKVATIKPNLKIDTNLNANNLRKNKDRSKSIYVQSSAQKHLTPMASKSSNNFQNIFDYYQEQINKIEKRKKSLFDFNLKKNEDSNTPEEDNQDSKNLLMNFGLMIEGDSISHCLEKEASPHFWKLMKACRSIIACRCSPLQKSEIVHFVKVKSKEITLAIGDGGNDVNMIKTADVGVGIFGKEGYQAAFNADYAISQFKYLKRLIFYHGRYSIERNSYFIYSFFFKNVFYTLPQFWLCFFSGFSGVNYYDEWYYLGFNSFLSAFPIGAKAIMDEDLDIEFKGYPNKEILRLLIPDIYKEYRDSVPFNIAKFFLVFFSSFMCALVSYFVPYFAFQFGIADDSGRELTYWDHSLSSYMSVIIVHFVVIIVDTHLYTWFNIAIYLFQIGIMIVFVSVHDARNSGEVSGITWELLGTLLWWMTTVFTSFICLLPFFFYRWGDYHFSLNIINNLRQKKYEYDYAKKVYTKKLEQMTKATRTIAKFKRLYKQTNVETDNYADKRMKEMVELYKTKKYMKDNKDKEGFKNEDIQVNNNVERRRCNSDTNLPSATAYNLDNIGSTGINIKKDLKKEPLHIVSANNLNIEHPVIQLETSLMANISSISENKEINEVKAKEANPSRFFDL